MYQTLRHDVARAKGDIVGLATDLVRTRSVSLGEGEMADRVEDAMRRLSFDLVFRDDAGNVIGAFVGSTEGPTLLLNSHMDTVAPGAASAWSASPYAGKVDDSGVYGVGAADCKAGLAAQIYAAALLASSRFPLGGNIVVAATVAEENGCSIGVRHLVDDSLPRIGMKPFCAILGEPTGLALCCGHDGWVDLDIAVRDGAAAPVAARRIVDELRTTVPEQRVAGRQLMDVSDPFVSAEASASVVRVTRRLARGQTVPALTDWLRRRVETIVGGGPVTIDVGVRTEQQRLFTGRTRQVAFETHPWATDQFEPIVDRAREALAEAGWKRPRVTEWTLRSLRMGTAGSVLVRRYRIPTIGFGPGDVRLAHQPNESVPIDRLVDATFGTAVLAHRLVGAPIFTWPDAPTA